MQPLEVLNVIASFLTPLVLLFLGIVINRWLEANKSLSAKEKDWQNWWAEKFLEIAHQYNTNITKFVTGLHQANQIANEKLQGWEDELKQKESSIHRSIRELQYLDWEIQNFTQFARVNGDDVLRTQKQLFDLAGRLIDKKQGNLEEIRNVQSKFNEAVRLAHAEILKIPSTE